MPYTLHRYHAFVSYQSGDGNAAAALVRVLQELGLRIWLDRDPGEHDRDRRDHRDVRGDPIEGDEAAIRSVLAEALGKSVLLIVLTSRKTLASTWVRTEVEIARSYLRPIFFWHLVDAPEETSVSVRRSGGPWDGRAETVREMLTDYRREPSASSYNAELALELSAQDLNVVGHVIGDRADVAAVGFQVNELIELCELVLHYRERIDSASLERHWPEYFRLSVEAESIEEQFVAKFGREVSVGRRPYSGFSSFKRPFVKKRVEHLKRLLHDESFRRREVESLRRES